MIFDDQDYKILIWVAGILGLLLVWLLNNIQGGFVCLVIVLFCFLGRLTIQKRHRDNIKLVTSLEDLKRIKANKRGAKR